MPSQDSEGSPASAAVVGLESEGSPASAVVVGLVVVGVEFIS